MLAQKSVIKINDIMMYVAVAVQHLRLMALLFCFSLLVGLTYYEFARPVFESRTMVRVRTFAEPVSNESIFHDGTRSAIAVQLEAPHIIERTARRFNVFATDREIRKKYFKKLTVQFDSEHNLLIDFYPYSYEWARDWPKVLVEEYLKYREEKRKETVQSTFATYTADMAEIEKNMNEVFALKRGFRETNKFTAMQIKLNQLKELPIQIYVVKHVLSRMDEIRESLKGRDSVAKLSLLDSLKKDQSSYYQDLQMQLGQEIKKAEGEKAPTIVVVPSVMPQPESHWIALDKKATALQQDMAKLGSIYLPGHHLIRKLKGELDQVNLALDREFQSALKTFELEYDSLLDKQRQWEKKLPEFEETSQTYDKMLADYMNFDSSQLRWREMLETMGKRLKTIDFVTDKERMLIEYVGPVEPVRDFPGSPNRLRVLALSLVMGLALAIAIPFLIAYLDNSVNDVEQVEESLRIRGLGVVPRVEEESINNLLVSGINAKPTAKPEYHLQENFRIIRTNLIMHAESPNHPQVILITSAMPQEGKTVVAANLAMSFATKGEKTLLIDGDLRRGRLHRLFGCQNKPGLSDVLSKYNTLADACRPSGNENLTIMTCGKHLNWASELLDTPNFINLMQDLRSQYQRIIIDTPPVLGLSETSIMQRMADSVLMVIWSGHTQMPNIKDAIVALQTNGAKFAGFVLNRLDFSAFANRYKYFYYSPRYYTNYKAIEASSIARTEG